MRRRLHATGKWGQGCLRGLVWLHSAILARRRQQHGLCEGTLPLCELPGTLLPFPLLRRHPAGNLWPSYDMLAPVNRAQQLSHVDVPQCPCSNSMRCPVHGRCLCPPPFVVALSHARCRRTGRGNSCIRHMKKRARTLHSSREVRFPCTLSVSPSLSFDVSPASAYPCVGVVIALALSLALIRL